MKLMVNVLFVLLSLICFCEGSCPNIVGRSTWGARAAKASNRFGIIPNYVVVHHSETPQCTSEDKCKSRVKNIQDFHMNSRGWDDIGYNFLVGGDGKVYEGRGIEIRGAHAPNYNTRSLGICLIGNFQNVKPPTQQLEALKQLIYCAVGDAKLSSSYYVVGHRQVRQTDCPGNQLFEEVKQMKNWNRNPY